MEQSQQQPSLVHPLTGKPIAPVPADLIIEVVAMKVVNKGGADQVVFECPFCRRRNKQNIRQAVNLPRPNVAAFRCRCSRVIHVRKHAVDIARIMPARG